MNDHTSEFELPVTILEVLVDEVPVDDFGEVLEIACSQIAIIDVVSMLPDVNS